MRSQVGKNSYNFQKYCDPDRWSSYWHQINEVLKCKPKSVLEVGVGDRVFSNYLKTNTKIDYKSLDIANDLVPDILGSVDNMLVEDNSFDVVCAFEVLEHLPFEKFTLCLNELKRVSRKHVIISLPHWGRHFSIKIRLPLFKTLKFQYKFNIFSINHVFAGQHYWEIGKRHYPLHRIKKDIKEAGYKISDDYVVFESPYHHFFVLEK